MEIMTVLKGRGEDDGEAAGVKSFIGEWFSSPWAAASPSVTPVDRRVCGPEASLDKGWRLFHAKEEAKG